MTKQERCQLFCLVHTEKGVSNNSCVLPPGFRGAAAAVTVQFDLQSDVCQALALQSADAAASQRALPAHKGSNPVYMAVEAASNLLCERALQ